jgi:hypothetical protein
MTSHSLRALPPLCVFGLVACTNSPSYLEPRLALEVGIPNPDVPDEVIGEATVSTTLPIRFETMEEQMERAARMAELGGVDVPIVGLGDLDIAIEWTIKNLSDTEAEARILINGANELFEYDPMVFVIDPDEDEPPPPLLGNVPITVPAQGTVSGVFREDQVREAAVDLELITRDDLNPFAALLQYHDDVRELSDAMNRTVPLDAFGHLVRYDFIFRGNQHLVLEYEIRVRDEADILHELLLEAPMGEQITFTPMPYVPPPPPPMMVLPQRHRQHHR